MKKAKARELLGGGKRDPGWRNRHMQRPCSRRTDGGGGKKVSEAGAQRARQRKR